MILLVKRSNPEDQRLLHFEVNELCDPVFQRSKLLRYIHVYCKYAAKCTRQFLMFQIKCFYFIMFLSHGMRMIH